MGGPPEAGQDQDVSVTISGPPESASDSDVNSYEEQFKKYKAEVKQLRSKYPLLRITVKTICYRKKDGNK